MKPKRRFSLVVFAAFGTTALLAACRADPRDPLPTTVPIPQIAASSSASVDAPPEQPGPMSAVCTPEKLCAVAWAADNLVWQASLAWHRRCSRISDAQEVVDDGAVPCLAWTRSPDSKPDVEVRITGMAEVPRVFFDLSLDARVERLSVVDVTGDGLPDLVVWVHPCSGPGVECKRNTYVFAAEHEATRGFRFKELHWTEAALGIVSSDDELRAAAPRLRSFVAPDATLPTTLLWLRMAFATVDDLRALTAPGGLDVCEKRSGHATPHGKHCTHSARQNVTADVIRSHLGGLEFTLGDDESIGLNGELCARTREGDSELCSRGTGGPANVELRFTGVGAKRRLSEVTLDMYEND
jgi:hypothetical protein